MMTSFRPFPLGRSILVCSSRLLVLCFSLFLAGRPVFAEHPKVIATNADREAIQRKIETADWARLAYATLKQRVDKYVALTEKDPKFVSSRLLMNWETHYTTPLVDQSRVVGGEGHAPVPTPRFEGARNWVTDYTLPAEIEDWPPNNDQAGKVRLQNKKSGQWEWVDPAVTAATFRGANGRILGLAADGAFVYWVTGDEKYAQFASEILWTYMEGFSYMQPPKPVSPDPGMMDIIGVTSFEVIHEAVVTSISPAYDFLYPYLTAHGKDVKVIQAGLKRFADRVIDGGRRTGNWNLNQAIMIAYAGLPLEGNEAYADGKGRPYYVDVVLNADLPRQLGVKQVIKTALDPETALWPEAAGYGFGSAAQIVELALLMSANPVGREILADPIMPKSLLNQGELLYPNGLSNGVGDTVNTRLNTGALELLIAWARQTGDTALEETLTPYLQREIRSGHYERGTRSDLLGLARFVPELRDMPAAPAGSRSFYFPGLNILMQRNLSNEGHDPVHSLAAAVFGTNGGHVHANGVAIELYGAGYVLGADPGRGSDYWSPDHGEYYSKPPAHNTVIVNGSASYDPSKAADKMMQLESVEPASQQEPMSPNVSFARASFHYARPAAIQSRTLALIRTGPNTGFYYDVFRSKTDGGENGKASERSFHDYLYHNMGQSLVLADASGQEVALNPSSDLASKDLLKGYSYFQDEKSAAVIGDFRATWTLTMPDGSKPTMNLWMPGQEGRTLYTANAPKNNAIRENIAAEVRSTPMPTLVVRKDGEAWNRPFVGVYEPFLAEEGASVEKVRAAHIDGTAPSLSATVVEGRSGKQSFRVVLVQDADASAPHALEGITAQTDFGVVIARDDKVEELYLGNGRKISAEGYTIESTDGNRVKASLRRDAEGWLYSADHEVTITVPGAEPVRRPAGRNLGLRG